MVYESICIPNKDSKNPDELKMLLMIKFPADYDTMQELVDDGTDGVEDGAEDGA